MFWTDNAAGWFAHVESRLRAKGVMDEWDRFDHTVAALSKEIIQLCFHAVAHPDDDELYTVLKEDLLQQHTLTKYQRIQCWGERAVQLDFHGRRFERTFLLADVSFAIIGVDFLRSHKLLVDPAANRLVDTASLQSFATVSAAAACAASTVQSPPSPDSTGPCRGDAAACAASTASAGKSPPFPGSTGCCGVDAAACAASACQSPTSPGSTGRCGGDTAACAASPPSPPPLSPEWLKAFLAEFEDVVCPSKVLPPVGTDVEHHIRTSGPPIASHFRRLDAEKLAAAKAEFLQLEKDGIVRRSDSPWSSPLHMVKKADGTWRPCGDIV
jgi:hypothetical protein